MLAFLEERKPENHSKNLRNKEEKEKKRNPHMTLGRNFLGTSANAILVEEARESWSRAKSDPMGKDGPPLSNMRSKVTFPLFNTV